MSKLALVSKDQFERCVGESLRFSLAMPLEEGAPDPDPDGLFENVELVLESLEDLPDHAPPGESPARKPFALLFRGPDDKVLPQAIYQLENPAGGDVPAGEIFIVPLGPDGKGSIRYEAVFN